ncbi:MAG: pentapeptide repeat-containing protein [Aulosira sp. ZfuVER01]|nr:pentapeptide repeat-containing protein [Aulosira sp. ZfuVER01]MDZ7998588.1 pentapeptide repeat-containing protein [Aulosira sp. DedVER01a]MDZ8052067.1 pentapeptide repeat-containing protein [Aulosira sp. ZfuCHP01]
MNLHIRQWLAENSIEIHSLNELSVGQMAGVAYRIVQDMEVKSLMPFDICTLTEVLELPLKVVREEITLIAHLTENLLRSLSQKKPLKRNEGTWLAFQIAYLHGLQQVLDQEVSLQKPWLDRAIIWNQGSTEKLKSPLQDAHLHELLNTLNPGKLTDTQAEQALSLVASSLLAQQINSVTIAWLVANGAEEVEAKLITQRLSHALPGYLLKVIAENPAPLAQLQKFVRLGNSLPTNSVVLETELVESSPSPTVDDKIDACRESYRVSLLQSLSQPFFMESFALKDIYVPLKGLPIEEESSFEQVQKIGSLIDLQVWAQQQLDDLETIAVIESEPGYGKTSFYQIWAAKVAWEIYPTWMPIVIRLRDIKYGQSLVATLNSVFPRDLQLNFATWVTQERSRCLLLLDGLDELPPTKQGNKAKELFIQELLNLQLQGRHKIFLTSRTGTLQQIAPALPQEFKRISIQPLDVEDLRYWFQQWTMVQSLPVAQNYFTFLKQAGLFLKKPKLPLLSVLVRQPLMLYLLGVLHRDGMLDDEILQLATNSAPLLWEIHHRLSRWLLGYPLTGGTKTMLRRSGSAHIHRTPEAIANLLSHRHPQNVLEQMQAIALQILHSDRAQINLSSKAKGRGQEAEVILPSASCLLPSSTDEFPLQTLPSFYFRTQHSLSIEFTHSNLGEYLCAEAIVTQLKILTQRQEPVDIKSPFILESPSGVAQHLYNLLGYGILSEEIEALVIEGLRCQQKWQFSFEVLFQRLESFWRDYCQGRWLDEGIVHQAVTNFHALQNPVNIEQVNAAVGLNVFLLLCSCDRVAKVSFLPCGHPKNLAEFNPQTLFALICRTAVLSANTFAKRVRSQSLAGINLSGAFLLHVILARVNLRQTNFSEATLMGANLAGANLTDANLLGANLIGANLTGANLTGANLTSANLTGANLTGANFTGANFTYTCLFDSLLSEVQKEVAMLNGAIFSLEEFQRLKRFVSENSPVSSFNTADNTDIYGETLLHIGSIESQEDEPTVPVDLP